MDLSKKLIAILAIFCIMVSAGAVCAADDDGGYLGSDYADDMSGYAGSQYDDGVYEDTQSSDDGGYAGSQYQDDGGWAGSQYEDGGYAGSQYQDDGGWAGSQYNETAENAAAANTNTTGNSTGNSTAPLAAGEPTNATSNITANATSAHQMLVTGNPILLLIGVSAALGGYAVFRRKN